MKITRQGVRDLNTIGPKPRPQLRTPPVWQCRHDWRIISIGSIEGRVLQCKLCRATVSD